MFANSDSCEQPLRENRKDWWWGGADFFDVVTVNVLQLVINEQLGAGLPLLLL